MQPARLQDSTDWAVRRLREWIGVPSVSTEGSCLEAGAAFTERLLDEVGLRTERLPGPGAPVVVGRRPAPAGRPTALIYGHYDVQPADPVEAWRSPPFEGTLRDGAVWGRGAGDNKGQLLCHLAAVRALVAADELPVGVTFLVEGEEEIGSPHVGEAVRRNRARLAADVALTSDAPGDAERPVVIFGVRGLLYVELTHRRIARDVHSGNRGGVAPSAAWELVRALAELRDASGRVALPGFEEAIRPPTRAEERMLNALPDPTPPIRAELGAEPLGGDAADLWRRLMFRPNCNLAGLDSGYQGPGAKTIVPREASCKIDFRLVADQDPEEVLERLRTFFGSRLPGCRVERIAAVPPSATDPSHSLCRAVVEGVEAARQAAPILRPRLGGTTPDWIFTGVLGIPSVLLPYGPVDMNHHAPNERMTLEALQRGIVTSLCVYRSIAAAELG